MNKYNPLILFIAVLLIISYLIIGCDKEVSTSPLEDEIPQAFLYVDSEPFGSTIYLNGKSTGRTTPDYIPFLEDGQYQVTLKKRYFRDTTFSVTLIEKDTFNIFIDYYQNPLMLGRITFNSSPTNSEIIINDSVTGLHSPASINSLTPGKYKVAYRLYNHRDSELEVIVESNKTTASYSVLRDTSEWIDYQISNSGIQSSLLTSIVSDNQNVKWIGTSNLGLISFNEKEFLNFNINNSDIPSNQINTLNVGNDNRIWVGTNNGLGIFDGDSWQIYNTGNSALPNNSINDIQFDLTGNAWIGTNNGFAKYDGVNWQKFNHTSQFFTYLWVTSLQFDGSNNLWIGSNNFGILKFDGSTFTEYEATQYNFLTNRISSIALDNTDRIWFGQLQNNGIRGGVSMYDGSAFSNFYFGTINNKMNNIYTTAGNKWFCTSEGLTKFDNNNSTIFFSTLNSFLSNDNITDVVKDLNGNIWITTFGGGLNKLKNQ